ncbi:aminotransferase class III-fold pyridoxal phosphate-dependent enzyme [Halopelagius longus]|uniref:4-aminobutyrate aminotransferase n=1 Tax=Halopelagius longus TaxID=1236180 RepID=A0A1H0ZAR2_9EURY|nr:aminotransferase class III-fold pyridoxal phosphate-dependent enzyme [Halopelagius longus]RDI72913.1 aminotransferase class III-fold pyridoxal phosphate-dependent enzyme [Halopelagius longus]SDQ24508.1 4-aminobutyrate aminotransferase [Halopelagius longus]
MDRDTAVPRVESLPGERAREWVDYHHETAAPSTYVYDFVWDITAEAEGPFCTDADGNVLLDFTSHVAAAPLGYNNPKIMDRMREFDLVDPLKIAGQDFYVSGGDDPGEEELPGPAGLMQRLVDITDHYDMDTVFLSNSGAEAVENAIKISYDHSGGAKYGITFEGAFHGRTLGALSLNRSKPVYRRKFPEISGIIDLPFCDDRTCSAETCSCGFFADGTSRLRKKLNPETGHVDPADVAYIILEPIQGEGGYRIPSEAFMDELAAVVEEYDITLVADEIQSGVGRTGEMWGSDHFAIEPDVITSAKALRVGATVSREEVFPEQKSRLSSTWGAGDIISSLQGALTIDAIREYDLMENAVVRGRQFKETVEDAALEPVEDVRGKGLMLGVEFDTKERRDAVQEACLQNGLLTLSCGYKVLRILPPLDVTEREIELGATLLLDSIEECA